MLDVFVGVSVGDYFVMFNLEAPGTNNVLSKGYLKSRKNQDNANQGTCIWLHS